MFIELYSKFSKFTKMFIQSTVNYEIPDKCILYPILYGNSRRKCTRHVFIKSESCEVKFLKPANDKLIKQTSCKYVRRAIYLVLLINSKCQ